MELRGFNQDDDSTLQIRLCYPRNPFDIPHSVALTRSFKFEHAMGTTCSPVEAWRPAGKDPWELMGNTSNSLCRRDAFIFRAHALTRYNRSKVKRGGDGVEFFNPAPRKARRAD